MACTLLHLMYIYISYDGRLHFICRFTIKIAMNKDSPEQKFTRKSRGFCDLVSTPLQSYSLICFESLVKAIKELIMQDLSLGT